MANTLITPENVARAALATYQYNAVLPRLCSRTFETEFGGGSGNTITIRKQASLTASQFDRNTGVVAQDITEGSLTVTVGDIYDVSAVITQEQWDLDLADFSFQVAEPMGKAMVRKSEQIINGVLEDDASFVSGSLSTVLADIVAARATLNANEVPLDGRTLVLGSSVASALITNDNLIKAADAGSADALRNAQIGRLFGMPVVESVVVNPYSAYIIHRDALTFVSITPQVPAGAVNASVQTYDSQAMRVVFAYDAVKKQDLISADAYLTAKIVRPEGIAAINFD